MDFKMDLHAALNDDDDANPLLKRIRDVYINGLFHDVVLMVGGMRLNAHRFLLSVSSDVFVEILMHSQNSESHLIEPIELQENPMCIEAFPIFLQYFYTGAMTVKHIEHVMPVLMLANKYNVMGLKKLCLEYMITHIVDAANQGYLVTWFQYGLLLNQPSVVDDSYYSEIWNYDVRMDINPIWCKLLKACRNFIKWNLDSCSKCFNTFECDILVGLLKQSDLVVHDEVQLFGCVVSWLNYKSAEQLLECNNADIVKDYMSSLTKNVMSYIRYPMILPKQMAHLLMASIVKENADFFVAKMAAAMHYHIVKRESVLNTDHTLECTPRLYTSEHWGVSFRMSFQVLQTVQQDLSVRGSSFDVDQEHNESEWAIKVEQYYDMLQPTAILNKIVQVNIGLKELQDLRSNVHNVRVTVLVYTLHKKCRRESAYVMSVLEHVGYFDNPDFFIGLKIVCGAINSLEETSITDWLAEQVPLKFHVIITPIVPGLTDYDDRDIGENKYVYDSFVF